MAEKLSVNALNLLINLGDKLADMVAVQIRAGESGQPAQDVIDQYSRVRVTLSEVRVQLEDFNHRVALAYSDNNPDPLRTLLAGEGYTRMENNFRDWRGSGIRALALQDYELLSLIMPEPAVGEMVGRRAEALTREVWQFSYDEGSNRTEESLNRYLLMRGEPGWQVEQVEFYTKG